MRADSTFTKWASPSYSICQRRGYIYGIYLPNSAFVILVVTVTCCIGRMDLYLVPGGPLVKDIISFSKQEAGSVCLRFPQVISAESFFSTGPVLPEWQL